jgi:hypothetical protein
MNPADPAKEDPTMLARSLPRALAPERDLWPEIEARLDATESDSTAPLKWTLKWRPALATAAGLVLAATVGFWLGDAADDSTLPNPVATEPPATEYVPVTHLIGSDLQQTRMALANRIYEQLELLPPESQSVITENLTVINQALDQIDAALEHAPESGLNRRLLMSMYADQLTLLNDMGGLMRHSNREIAL